MSEGPLVVKIGGAGVDRPSEATALWSAVLEAHRTVNGRLVLVHGGGRAVDAHLDRLGFTTTRIDGLRVTPPDQVDEIAAVLAGRVNKALVGAINAAARPRCPAVGLCLGDGGVLATRVKRPASGADLGRVGEADVSASDAGLLRLLIENAYLPVLCSIGLDREGRPLNVNADDAAAGIAQSLRARGLVLLTDVEAVRGADGNPIGELTAAQIERLIGEGVISGGMIPKVRAALETATAARVPAFIASFNKPGDLPRLARGEAAGTRILPG